MSQRDSGRNREEHNRKKHEVEDEHHFRPTSRGGADNPKNKVMKPKRRIHEPYHRLFGNLRPHEVITLFIVCWDTFYPYNEMKEPETNQEKINGRIRAWNKLFGGECAQEEAIAIIRQEFSRGHETLIKEVLAKLKISS